VSCLLRYVSTTGSIQSVWVGNPASLLEAQIVPEDPDYGYLLSDTTLDADVLQQQWEVVGGALTAKMQAILTPDVLTFASDGSAACTIQVVPFMPCALSVNGDEPVNLTPADTTLVLTSDIPAVFHVQLMPMPRLWAEPILVEAV
jgi:hypothetical protein